MQVTVFMSDWEIECCQPPPGVGDQVAWRLQWSPGEHGAGSTDLSWDARPLDGGRGAGGSQEQAAGLLLRAGPVTAWWSADPAEQDAAPPSPGCLVVDAHGQTPEAMSPVQGRVVAVDVVDQAYRRTGWRSCEPVPEGFQLGRVDRGPTSFARGWAPGVRTSGDGPPEDRWESGVLVHLDVDAGPRDRRPR